MMERIALAAVAAGSLTGTVADGGTKLAYGSSETYRQRLVVECPQPAELPVPRLASVYNGHKWGLSTRWDDSNPNALNVRGKMIENGIRGTFYLNSRTPETAPDALACKLTGKDECSVGGHSVTHPKLPDLPANEVFYELMANRITLECLTDRPVNSLAFPYGQYQARDRPEVLQGVTEAFLRTGFHHCVYSGFVTRNPFLAADVVSTGLQVRPGDRQVDAEKFWPQVEKIRQNEAGYRKTSDCIFLGVHPWQKGDELVRLGEVMGKLYDWDDFWHCTQTEYAAFAKQRKVTEIEVEGGGVYRLVRPCGFELGSDTPLTLEFDSEDVRSARVDGIECPVRKVDGKTFVNVPHAPQSGAPTMIDDVTGGSSSTFPGLQASVTFDVATGAVAFSLTNTSDSAVTDAVLTVSLPPAYEPGMLRWQRAELAAGDAWSVSAEAAQTREGDYWHGGRRYVVAQLDLLRDGRRARLFATFREG